MSTKKSGKPLFFKENPTFLGRNFNRYDWLKTCPKTVNNAKDIDAVFL